MGYKRNFDDPAAEHQQRIAVIAKLMQEAQEQECYLRARLAERLADKLDSRRRTPWDWRETLETQPLTPNQLQYRLHPKAGEIWWAGFDVGGAVLPGPYRIEPDARYDRFDVDVFAPDPDEPGGETTIASFPVHYSFDVEETFASLRRAFRLAQALVIGLEQIHLSQEVIDEVIAEERSRFKVNDDVWIRARNPDRTGHTGPFKQGRVAAVLGKPGNVHYRIWIQDERIAQEFQEDEIATDIRELGEPDPLPPKYRVGQKLWYRHWHSEEKGHTGTLHEAEILAADINPLPAPAHVLYKIASPTLTDEMDPDEALEIELAEDPNDLIR